ncbi:hypothetical protein Tco_1417546 [Tanacetum coccineum]
MKTLKELIVALRGELYFDQDPFEDDYEKTEKSMDDWDQLLDFKFDDIPHWVEKNFSYIGPSSSTLRHLTQNEAAKEALTLRISQKFALLEEEEAINKVKGEALKEKDDLRAFIFPIRFEGKINENALADTGSDINTMPYLIYEKLGREEIKKAYLNCNDPAERSLALQAVINPFQKINVWKKAVSFLGSLPVPLQHVDWKPDYKGCYTNEEEAKGQWRTEIRLWEETMMKPDHQDPNALDNTKPWKRYCFHKFIINSYYGMVATKRMGCDGEIDDMLRIKLRKAGSNEEIFTSVAWIRAFNINEPIYSKLCHEFYSTYEFDEVCADDELQTKKIIKFRLGGRAHCLTLLEFACRLGLYHAEELDEEGFDVYFQGGFRSDEHFNAQEYWLSISREENLSLSWSQASTIRSPVLRAIHKMITYVLYTKMGNEAWLIARWMKKKGAGTQNKSQNCYGQFIMKIARKARVLSDVVIRSLSALIYCRDLDTTTLRELIDFEGRLIPEDPQPGVLRVAIPRPPRASMQDLYAGVFEHMAGVYSVPLQGAYNPPGYAQPQYDQYYQQYLPQPP